MSGHTPWSQIKHKRDHVECPSCQSVVVTVIPDYTDEGQSKGVCGTCGYEWLIEPPIKGWCMNRSPLNNFPCALEPGHEGVHESSDGLFKWGHDKVERDSGYTVGIDTTDDLDLDYPYQTEATETLEEFIKSHVNAYRMVEAEGIGPYDAVKHDQGPKCKHCMAVLALGHLNQIIDRQMKAIRELSRRDERRFKTIQRQREDLATLHRANNELVKKSNAKWLCDCHTWPSPEEAHKYIEALERDAKIRDDTIQRLKEDLAAEAEAYRQIEAHWQAEVRRANQLTQDLKVMTDRKDEYVDELQACNRELHNQKQHELGRECADLQDRLDAMMHYIRFSPDIAPRDRQALKRKYDGKFD